MTRLNLRGRAGALLDGNPLLPLVALAGFSVSFQTIAGLARKHHLPGWPPVYPLGIDLGILALVIESRKAVADSRSDLVPRAGAWLLSAFTIYANAHGAAASDWLGRSLHIVMPALWVLFLELTRWRQIRARRKARGERDRIPLVHWIAAPLATPFMWRRMVLRNVRSYALAVELEDARRRAADLLSAHYGRWWKREAPRALTARIRSGRLGDDVTRAASTAVSMGVTGGWDEAVRAMVAAAVTEGDKLTVTVRREKRKIDRQDKPEDDRPPKPRRPVRSQLSATAKRRADVERLLKQTPPLPVAEIMRRTGASESTVTRVKRSMAERREPADDAAEG